MVALKSGQIKALEENCVQNSLGFKELMENAGKAVFESIKRKYKVRNKRVTILCGSGNNGGDGFVVARYLFLFGAKPVILLTGAPPKTDISKENLESAKALNIPVFSSGNREKTLELIQKTSLIVDAVFGFGFHGQPDERTAEIINQVNQTGLPVVSVDLPSGVYCDTAEISNACVKACLTVTFSCLKPALISYPAAEYAGEVEVADIGVPKEAFNGIEPKVYKIEESMFKDLFERKPQDHKGTFGKAFLICGSVGMSGAAILSAKSAAKSGAGLVTLATVKSNYIPAASNIPEAIIMPLDENTDGTIAASEIDRLVETAERASAVLFGCGIGNNQSRVEILKALLNANISSLVIDADGINALCGNINIVSNSKIHIVITPHPGEMARLSGKTVKEIQASRINAAKEFALAHGLTVILKGAKTVVASKDGRVYLNGSGNPGLAKGGSGDVLAGMVTSFLAQGISPDYSAAGAVYIHGKAGDNAAQKYTMNALLPSDVIAEFSSVFSNMKG